jgi:excisionase family DNA binding protein
MAHRVPPGNHEEALMNEDPVPQRPLTISEAATYLNVTERFMRRLVAERRIAFHKVGYFVRFLVSDLDRFLADGRVEPPAGSGRPR